MTGHDAFALLQTVNLKFEKIPRRAYATPFCGCRHFLEADEVMPRGPVSREFGIGSYPGLRPVNLMFLLLDLIAAALPRNHKLSFGVFYNSRSS